MSITGIESRCNAPSFLMRLIKVIVRPFYSTETRACAEQLHDDFGGFPPAPLHCDGISGEFDVVRTRGIGEIWHTLIVHNRMFRGLESDTQYLSADFMECFGADQMSAFRHALEGFGSSAKFIKPAVITLVLGMKGIKLTIRMVQSAHQESKVLGCFLPVRERESEIVVKSGRHAHLCRSEAPTISHEHNVRRAARINPRVYQYAGTDMQVYYRSPDCDVRKSPSVLRRRDCKRQLPPGHRTPQFIRRSLRQVGVYLNFVCRTGNWCIALVLKLKFKVGIRRTNDHCHSHEVGDWLDQQMFVTLMFDLVTD